MATQIIKLLPPSLLGAASSVAAAGQRAAVPQPGVIPTAAGGSPADGALAAISATIAGRSAKLSTEAAGKGPMVLTTTQSGVAQLQAQDSDNAAQIEAVGESAATQAVVQI
jgi:hypothetical protein